MREILECPLPIWKRAGRGRVLFQKLAGGEWIDLYDNLALAVPTGNRVLAAGNLFD
ncbi:MAG: hypothetical protein ACREDM_03265 [Methylocella sp.]